jgi:hypothetical protein
MAAAMRRWALNILAGLSMGLCLLATATWASSYVLFMAFRIRA